MKQDDFNRWVIGVASKIIDDPYTFSRFEREWKALASGGKRDTLFLRAMASTRTKSVAFLYTGDSIEIENVIREYVIEWFSDNRQVNTNLDQQRVDLEKTKVKKRRYEPKTSSQERLIIEILTDKGFDPKALPKREVGKPWIKSEIWQLVECQKDLFSSYKTFRAAWQRLRDSKQIVETNS